MGCSCCQLVEEKENERRLTNEGIFNEYLMNNKKRNERIEIIEEINEKNQQLEKQRLKELEEEKKEKEEEIKRKKEEEIKRKKEEEIKRKKEEEEKQKKSFKIIDSLIELPDDNIEVISFTQKTMDLQKMRELELLEHNYLRSLHGAKPLVLNEDLNEMAQNYAKVLAKKKIMEHSKKRNLKGKEGQWVGENLYCEYSSGTVKYACGEMSKSWYSEIKDYDFKTGKSKGGVIGHFTQLVWKNTREVGFGVDFNEGFLISVANYYPGGNYNNDYLNNVGKLVPDSQKSSKELFDLNSVKIKELELINLIRKNHNVEDLELDENLCNLATKHAESIVKTGVQKVYKNNGNWENWTNWSIMKLIRGANYRGGEATKKWYKKLKEYDFNKKSAKESKDSFYINMGVALIWKEFKKVGFGYYFSADSSLCIVALFDGLVYNNHNNKVFPAS